MSVELYYHPFTRAANVVWMLEEVGVEYELKFMDIISGEHKNEALLSINPMGKLPTIVDEGTVVSESAAIGLYLADRYALGTLAPKPDDPTRGAYLRWSLFAPSVIEPGLYAKSAKWAYKEAQAGWGNHEAMLETISHALSRGSFLLGEQFSMADAIFGGTVRFMLQFDMLEKRPEYEAYAARISERPAWKRADEINSEWREKVKRNKQLAV